MKQWKKMLVAGMVAAGVVGLVAGCGSDSAKNDSTQKPKTIIAGLDDTFAPMGFRDENGNIVGFDVDIAKAVSKEIGVEIEFKPIDWASKESELNSGRIDCIWNGLSITPEREEKMDFTNPYMNNDQIYVVIDNSDIKSASDLKGKRICFQEGSTVDLALNKNMDLRHSFGEIKTYPDFTSCFLDLDANRADAVLVDGILADYYMTKSPGKYRRLPEKLSTEPFAIGVKKGNEEIVKMLNEGIEKVKASGEAAKISQKWFQRDVIG